MTLTLEQLVDFEFMFETINLTNNTNYKHHIFNNQRAEITKKYHLRNICGFQNLQREYFTYRFQSKRFDIQKKQEKLPYFLTKQSGI